MRLHFLFYPFSTMLYIQALRQEGKFQHFPLYCFSGLRKEPPALGAFFAFKYICVCICCLYSTCIFNQICLSSASFTLFPQTQSFWTLFVGVHCVHGPIFEKISLSLGRVLWFQMTSHDHSSSVLVGLAEDLVRKAWAVSKSAEDPPFEKQAFYLKIGQIRHSENNESLTPYISTPLTFHLWHTVAPNNKQIKPQWHKGQFSWEICAFHLGNCRRCNMLMKKFKGRLDLQACLMLK